VKVVGVREGEKMYYFSSVTEFSMLREIIKTELDEILGEDASRVFIALNEGVNNAIVHGNKGDNRKKVCLKIEKINCDLHIVICDEGDGFCTAERFEMQEVSSEHGRGFEIIQYCVDSYRYNERGNEITLIKKIR